MARKQGQRSLGEMISTVCFYGVGFYFLLEGTLVRDEGGGVLRYGGLWLAGLLCVSAGARYTIASFVMRLREPRK